MPGFKRKNAQVPGGSGSGSRTREIHAATLLCLGALILQILLPVVHSYFVHSEECRTRPGLSPAAGYVASSAPELRSDFSGVAHHPHHDADACAICRTILSSHNFLDGFHADGWLPFLPVESVPLESAPLYIAGDYLAPCSPRSPPCMI